MNDVTPVKLPFNLEAKTIAMMIPGETLYTVPWAMVVDKDRTCWVRGDYTVDPTAFGTVNAEIHRNSKGFALCLTKPFEYTVRTISEAERRDWDLYPVIGLKG